MRAVLFILPTVVLATTLAARAAEAPPTNRLVRSVPAPLPHHPGNVFLAGEDVAVPAPDAATTDWRLLDYDEQPVAQVRLVEGKLLLGRLPVGFYRLRPKAGSPTNWTSLAVLQPLKTPTPLSSPIGLDVAMAWFYPREKMDAVASLCTLAGVNWVRDRLSWGQVEPQPHHLANLEPYDASAAAQSRAGLRVLQVNHISPAWANPTTKRFPPDLRDAHRFYREMARRWAGQVLAFEPWNEPDIDGFGGHTGSEIAAFQKAASLGLKSGNPAVIPGLAVFALHNPAQLADLEANEAWPYFDTFNFHHYAPFDEYPKLYADFRAVSAGRPLWVTEAALPVRWADAPSQEPSDADLRVQAERIAKTFATSLHEGTAVLFYFLLPHYVEGQTQFGIVRPDLTPRPAYVALAAVGRLLADARPLGQVLRPGAQKAFLFRARPAGRDREVLVTWDAGGKSDFRLPSLPEAVADHLGRALTRRTHLELGEAPLFAVLPRGTAKRLPLVPPPQRPQPQKQAPATIVLQPLWPAERTDLRQSAYRLAAEKPEVVPVYAYNFGSRVGRGTFRVTAPAGWTVRFAEAVELAPGDRKELPLSAVCGPETPSSPATIRIAGDFGKACQLVLSLRLEPEARP